MRCLSPIQKYSIQVFEGKEKVVMDVTGYAQRVVLNEPVVANFDKSGLLDHEIEDALAHFSFSGLPEGVNPLTRISVFDTEMFVEQKYPKEERSAMVVQINDRLRELQERFPSEFIITEPPLKERPWPTYDTDSAEDILKFQERLRIDPESIRLYELENQNRQEIVDAMLVRQFGEQALEPAGDGEEIVVGPQA